MPPVEPAQPSHRVGVALLLAVAMSLGAVFPLPAQTLYRCVQQGKPVSLQSTPCAAGAKTTKAVPYTPDAQPTANELAWKRYRTEREMAARNQAMRWQQATSGPAVVLPAGGSACEQAKADRDAWERRVGLSRTIDGMRAWQEHVYRACR